MVQIKVTVIFNDTNKYMVQLPHSTKLGMLSKILPTVIGRTEQDVLYTILAGQMVGFAPYSFDKTLADCQTVGHTCMVHLIFKDPKTKYSEFTLSSSERNLLWHKKQAARQESVNAGGMGNMNGIGDFIQTLGQVMMDDVVVTIDTDDISSYVTPVPDDVDLSGQACSVCQEDMAGTETVRLACGHSFHSECIHDWLTTSSTKCPTCNRDVREQNFGP